MNFSTVNRVLIRTLQYIETLRLASMLTGLNLLDGRGKKALDVGCGSGIRRRFSAEGQSHVNVKTSGVALYFA